jgi:outer membrane protein
MRLLKTRLPMLLLAGVFLAAATLTPAAADLKIGFVRFEYIFNQYKGTKEAQARLEKELKKWEQDAENMQKDIKDLEDKREKQALLMSEQKKKELDDIIANKKIDLNKFVYQKLGQKGDAVQKNDELVKPIIEKINAIIKVIAEEENYDLIMDAGFGGVFWAKNKYDLTERILKELNKQSAQ